MHSTIIALTAHVTIYYYIGSCDGKCIENLPVFRDQGKNSPSWSLDSTQVVIPAYRISCTGEIVQWGVATERRGGHLIELQVWRETASNQYIKIGGNLFNNGPKKGEKLIYFTPNSSEQISVKPGDFLGVYSSHNPGISDNYKIQYHSSSNVQMLLLENSPVLDLINPMIMNTEDAALLLHVNICKLHCINLCVVIVINTS